MNIKKISFHLVKGKIFDCRNASVIATLHSIAYSAQADDAYRAHNTKHFFFYMLLFLGLK